MASPEDEGINTEYIKGKADDLEKSAQKRGLVKPVEKIEHLRLSMYEPGALESGKLDGLAEQFCGSRAKWLIRYVTNDERALQREASKKKSYLKVNPGVDSDSYDGMRAAQLQRYQISVRGAINTHFYKTAKEEFEVTGEDIKRFVDRQISQATAAMRTVANTLYPDSGVIGLRNETGLIPVSPAKVIETIGSNNTDPILKSELIKRQLNAYVSTELDKRNSKLESERKLAQIQELLDRKLFEAPIGSTENVSVEALYDNDTNTVEFIGGIDGRVYKNYVPEGKHIKTRELTMRKIKDTDIRIFTNPDIKKQGCSIVKAIRKTQEAVKKGNSDEIKTQEYVQDTHRVLFAVDGGPEELAKVVDKIKKLLEDPDNQQYLAKLNDADEPMRREDGELVGRVVSVTDDSSTNGYDTQSKNVKWTRLQVGFDDLPLPIEIKFQDMKHFLLDEFEVGTYDSQIGIYTGAAHELYRYNRAKSVAPYFISVEELGKDIDPEALALETQEKIVFNLRHQTKKVR